jgi:mono/diheme cytochrome c family protein
MRVFSLSTRSSKSGTCGGARIRVLAAPLRRLAGGAFFPAALTLTLLAPAAPLLAQTDAPQPETSRSEAAKPEAPTPEAATSAIDPKPPEASSSDIDGQTMFATSCGFCHEDGGRSPGKGPQLANSARTDGYLVERIKKGKPGAMSAFGRVFSDGQITAILAYIRGLDE